MTTMNETIDDIVTRMQYEPLSMLYVYDINGVRYKIKQADYVECCNIKYSNFKEMLYDAHERGGKDSGTWEMKYDYIDGMFVVSSPYDEYEQTDGNEPEQDEQYTYECMMPNCSETMTAQSTHDILRSDCNSCSKTTQFEKIEQQ